MSIWYAIPSALQDGGTLRLWRDAGYRLAAWRDIGAEPLDCEIVLEGGYPGYALAVNQLMARILDRDSLTQWIVTGGDDVEPCAFSPGFIGDECSEHFGGSFGVMQPTGDGHGIETICGSPWIGREFCERAYGGRGPFWPEYHHNFVDQELQEVSKMLGCLWQRPDLSHKHNNWMWTTRQRPAHLEAAYSKPEWDKAMAIFMRRKAQGFPGHEVCDTMMAEEIIA